MEREAAPRFTEEFSREIEALSRSRGFPCTYDLLFLAFLHVVSQFGYFRLGPISIEVDRVEELVNETLSQAGGGDAHDDFVDFSQRVMTEVRTSGRRRIDELHYLFAFMRCDKGVPARVFGELGIVPEQVERSLRDPASPVTDDDRLLTPEEVADYLRVHVETVRSWIRSGRLPARRVAGLRALRVKASDAEKLLMPLDQDSDK